MQNHTTTSFPWFLISIIPLFKVFIIYNNVAIKNKILSIPFTFPGKYPREYKLILSVFLQKEDDYYVQAFQVFRSNTNDNLGIAGSFHHPFH